MVGVAGGAVVAEILGDGPPLLLLHGWTLDRRMWTCQAQLFSKRFQVIAVDRRGYGQATAPPDPSREVDDLEAVLATLHLERCAVVGMSQGARVALALAVRKPRSVTALVLQGAPFPCRRPEGQVDIPAREMKDLAARGALSAMRAKWRDSPLMEVQGKRATAIRNAMIDSYRGEDLLLDAQHIILDPGAVAAISVPSLLLTGVDEAPNRKDAVGCLAALLPLAERRGVPGGHLCNLGAPKSYNRTVLEFLDLHAQ